MKVFRDFDQETLNNEYRIRDSVTVDEFEANQAKSAADSARMRETLDARLDQLYGSSADEVMDIFPAGEGVPVFVFIHGGYWRMLSQKESCFMAETFTHAGAAVAALNYSLAPETKLDEIVRQCRAAVAWLYANATNFGVDPKRIHVAGSSAGGHLTGMVLAGGWHKEFGVPEDIVRGACALSGLHDLEPVKYAEPNEWLDLDDNAVARNSPIRHLPAQGCPLIVSYGGNETAEFKRQTDDYAAAWRAEGFSCRHIAMDGCNHFNLPQEFCNPASPLTRAVFEQMGL